MKIIKLLWKSFCKICRKRISFSIYQAKETILKTLITSNNQTDNQNQLKFKNTTQMIES